jgi:hypothetical protein
MVQGGKVFKKQHIREGWHDRREDMEELTEG